MGEKHTTHVPANCNVAWRELLAGRRQTVWHGPEEAVARQTAASAAPPAVFPGSFNPLHEGHRRMAQIAETSLGRPIVFEISVENVDKPPLDETEIAKRLAEFSREDVVVFTRAATFAEKARLFPGATFVIGVDTLKRIGDAAYYADHSRLEVAIREITVAGVRFLAFGRSIDGRFRLSKDAGICQELFALCEDVPEEVFRCDVSSSQIRSQRNDRRAAGAD